MDLTWLANPQIWISLTTLTVLEIVLGIDNIIFISILAGKLPEAQQARARTVGLMLALVTRVLLLCSIFWLTKLTADILPDNREVMRICEKLGFTLKHSLDDEVVRAEFAL